MAVPPFPQKPAAAPMPAAAPAPGPSMDHGGILARFEALSPEEQAILDQGISPEATQVLMKVFSQFAEPIRQMTGPNDAPEAEAEAPEEPMPEEVDDAMPPPRRPRTALGEM